MDEKTLVVSIGRGVGNSSELDGYDWSDFKESVESAVADFAPIVYRSIIGQGIWEGKAEEAFTVIATVNNMAGWARLHDRLEHLAKQYLQDAIAVTLGETTLIPQY